MLRSLSLPRDEMEIGFGALRRLVAVLALAASLVVFVAVDSRSHSVSDTFYGMVVPELLVLGGAVSALFAARVIARGRP